MPLRVQVLVEALPSRMRYQMCPAAPSLSWTDPRSAEAAQRPGVSWPLDGPVVAVECMRSDPSPDGRVVVGAEPTGDAVAEGWEAVESAR
jgi:hypothetical protein